MASSEADVSEVVARKTAKRNLRNPMKTAPSGAVFLPWAWQAVQVRSGVGAFFAVSQNCTLPDLTASCPT
jgi:hypothetical protein